MKSAVLILMLAATLARAQTNNLTSLLQQGLLEEQANRNLDAAIANYQTLAAQFDQDRQLAATAVFRIGECYRMQGRTNEAAAQYQRVLRDFADQTTLATLSRQNLTGMGFAQTDLEKTTQPSSEDSVERRSLAAKIAGIEKMKSDPVEYAQAVQAIFPDDNLRKMLERLPALQAQESELKVHPKSTDNEWSIQVAVDPSKRFSTADRMQGTNLLDMAKAELQKQNDLVAERVDFILGIEKARLKVLQSTAGSNVASDSNQNDSTSVTTDEEDQEIQRIQTMIQNSPDLINAANGDGNTPLQKAAYAGWFKVAAFLLDHGADINAGGISALNQAARAGNRAMVEFLLSRGANVNAKGENGKTPLHTAAEKNFQTVAEVLLANKADVNAVDTFGDTPLISASRRGNAKMVSLLLDHKADVNVQNNSRPFSGGFARQDNIGGRTALSFAAESSSPEIVKMLLAAKADPNLGGFDLPLFEAINHNDVTSAELLLQTGANPNVAGIVDWNVAGNNMGRAITPLFFAVSEIKFPLVQLLLKYKADPDDTQTDGRSLLYPALGDMNILEALLDAGARADGAADPSYWSPLESAAYGNNAAAVEILLKHGADANLATSDGRTPLYYAAEYLAGTNVFQLLLDHKANPNVRQNGVQTPLDKLKEWMAGNGNNMTPAKRALAAQLVDFLRQHGALDKLPDWNCLTVSRPSANFSSTLFYKGTNDWNQVSLFDVLGVQYNLIICIQNQVRRDANPYSKSKYANDNSLPYPNFASVIIHHPTVGGTKWETRKIDLTRALDSGDCGADILLQWGDVVEIPEADHVINQRWTGLTTNQLLTLKNCLTRHLQITVNGQTTNIIVSPQVTIQRYLEANDSELPSGEGLFQKDVYLAAKLITGEPFMLWPVLDESKMLLASSDLAHVKIKRAYASGKIQEWIVDCSNLKDSPPNFWLRDGDVIEVPEK